MSEQNILAPCVLFVGNLPYAYTDGDLKQLFKDLPGLTAATIVQDERDRSRGFGFIRFDQPEQAQYAIDKLNGSQLEGRKLRLNLARQDSRYLPLVED